MTDDDQRAANVRRILESPSYRVAYRDVDFLLDPKLRPSRMELELLKPELYLERAGIRSTVVVFGGSRIVESAQADQELGAARAKLAQNPQDARCRRQVARAERLASRSHYYELARQFARLVSNASLEQGGRDYVICTGGGPGIMEAANRGAHDVGARSIGLNIRLPREQQPNPFVTPNLCFQFHYFAMRKMHFLLRAKALVVFPGGFGTLDELFDALTLRQTGRMQPIPIILFGREYWDRIIHFEHLAEEGAIDQEDLDLIRFVETPQEAWDAIVQFHDGQAART